ncbi:hypothetical protein KC19_VG026100 [Ceratodon purpureus]|uniref:Uncharacterized protein n=1 Tax=Ceratodon purpureus TaxID=3225 RepID=A0A8T0HLD5_CERPU|nr:hypothetical protein KC19_VG026100 [Ceratodon purpureus]
MQRRSQLLQHSSDMRTKCSVFRSRTAAYVGLPISLCDQFQSTYETKFEAVVRRECRKIDRRKTPISVLIGFRLD